jgi:hypothetical protein
MNRDNIKARRLLCIETDDHILRIMNMEILSLYISINIKINIYTELTHHDNTTLVYTTLTPEPTMIPKCGVKYFIAIQMLSVKG